MIVCYLCLNFMVKERQKKRYSVWKIIHDSRSNNNQSHLVRVRACVCVCLHVSACVCVNCVWFIFFFAIPNLLAFPLTGCLWLLKLTCKCLRIFIQNVADDDDVARNSILCLSHTYGENVLLLYLSYSECLLHDYDSAKRYRRPIKAYDRFPGNIDLV